MRGKKAKKIRREVYGDLGSGPGFRKYRRVAGTEMKMRKGGRIVKYPDTGQIIADEKRREYQHAKKTQSERR